LGGAIIFAHQSNEREFDKLSNEPGLSSLAEGTKSQNAKQKEKPRHCA